MKQINKPEDIDFNIPEGRLLLAAISEVNKVGYLLGKGGQKILSDFNWYKDRADKRLNFNPPDPKINNQITTFKQIDSDTPEGKLLLFAIFYLCENLSFKTKEAAIDFVNKIAAGIFSFHNKPATL